MVGFIVFGGYYVNAENVPFGVRWITKCCSSNTRSRGFASTSSRGWISRRPKTAVFAETSSTARRCSSGSGSARIDLELLASSSTSSGFATRRLVRAREERAAVSKHRETGFERLERGRRGGAKRHGGFDGRRRANRRRRRRERVRRVAARRRALFFFDEDERVNQSHPSRVIASIAASRSSPWRYHPRTPRRTSRDHRAER